MNQKKCNDFVTSSGVDHEDLYEELSTVDLDKEPTVADLNREPAPDPKQVNESVNRYLDGECNGQFYYVVVRENDVLPPEDFREIAIAYSRGDKQARESLILHNLKLVIFFARKYENRGVKLNDLIQEGNIGLMKAVERFDYKRGFALSTYARWWIVQFIKNSLIKQTGPIRIPSNKYAKRGILFRYLTYFENKFGRKPETDEIAAKLEVSVEAVAELLSGRGNEAFSLDSVIVGDDGRETSRLDLFPDANAVSPYTMECAKEAIEQSISLIGKLLSALASHTEIRERNKVIFRQYLGLDGSVRVHNTLKTIGEHYGVTRERIRQVVERTWKKMTLCRPRLELDENKLLALYRRMKVLEEGVGYRIKLHEVLPSLSKNGLYFSDAVAERIEKQPRKDKNPLDWGLPSFMKKSVPKNALR